jgi:hypothetical protein
MKSSILPAAILLFCTFAGAQNTFRIEHHDDNDRVVNNKDNLYFSVGSYEEHKTYFDIVNTSNTANTYAVRRYDIERNVQGLDSAVALFCYGIMCYPPSTRESSDPVSIPPGERTSNMDSGIPNQSMMLYPYLTEIENPGFSHIKYTVFNVYNTSDSIQFSMRYNDPNAGIASLRSASSAMVLSPNPARDQVQIRVNLSGDATCKVKMFNTLGALVSERTANLSAGQNSLKLDVSDLKNGVYFVSFSSGKEISVQRLVIH